MIIPLSEVKTYLRVDFTDDDTIIEKHIETAETLIQDTLRQGTLSATSLNKVAVLYAVAYLYEHKESADMNELTRSLRYILATQREVAF